MSSTEQLLAAALARYSRLERAASFDPNVPHSAATEAQRRILQDLGRVQYRYVVAGNRSGKSQTGAWEVAHIFSETHPNWSKPEQWGQQPIQIIASCNTRNQIESVLWRKIEQYLDSGTYKLTFKSGSLTKATHTATGNQILFISHHSEREARERMQGFDAHYVWLDEMPKSYRLLEELELRVLLSKGYFLATFTPKIRNDDIRRHIDGLQPPIGRKYQLCMFDNPCLTDHDIADIQEQYASYSESFRRTVFYGEWGAGEEAVFDFEPDRDMQNYDPERYSKGWRHVVSVDPALSSKLGFTLWAEDPTTGVWYLVRADYVVGHVAPSDIVADVESRVANYNVVRRISDPHEVWYIGEASKRGYTYMGVYKKANRKSELIKNFQQALTDGRIRICGWCDYMLDELLSCSWSETVDGKIVNASSYHLLDAAQYFVDLKPKGLDPMVQHANPDVALRQEFWRQEEARERQRITSGRIRRGGIWGSPLRREVR